MRNGNEDTLHRRQFLATLAGGSFIGGIGGCLDTIAPRQGNHLDLVSLTIKAPPSEEDAPAAAIATRITENLQSIGLSTRLVIKEGAELYRDILLDHDFDVFVSRSPSITDPDRIRPLVHSAFDGERGWQNPFGVSETTIDDLADTQRRETDRTETVHSLQHALLEHLPFSVIATFEEITGVADQFAGSDDLVGLSSWYDFVRFNQQTYAQTDVFRVAILDDRITINRNPLTQIFAGTPPLFDLVYDSILRHVQGTEEPWLAESVEWSNSTNGPVADIVLRPDLRWHDGNQLTAEDVEFTYDLFEDTTLGAGEEPVPAPRYRGRVSLIDTVEAQSPDVVRFKFDAASQSVASRALRLPILPKHDWRDYATSEGSTSLAIERPNEWPIGSGMLEVVDVSAFEYIHLAKNSGHFLNRAEYDHLSQFEDIQCFDRLEFVLPTRPPVIGAAVNLLEEGDIDAITAVPPRDTPAVVRSPSASLAIRATNRSYLLGFNLRRRPCSDLQFRRAVARCLDRTAIVANDFRGYARPTESLLSGTSYMAPALEWDGESVLGPFPGSSGRLDVEAGQDLFSAAGYAIEDERVYYE